MRTDSSTRGWVLGLAAVATFMVALDTLVVSTALTSIQRDLGASIAQLEWTVNGYNLAFAVLILTAAAVGDRYGRRRVFAAGIALFTLASATARPESPPSSPRVAPRRSGGNAAATSVRASGMTAAAATP